MRERDIKTAEKVGILKRCQAFEQELLQIKDIVPDKSDDGIPFQVIIVPQYDISADRDDYWEARKALKDNVVALAEKYDLRRSGDCIEDQGRHFYFVFNCGPTWYTH